ncbi:MAG: hypothetical protein ABIH03_05495, partial [Pseudomonadota bacterium]
MNEKEKRLLFLRGSFLRRGFLGGGFLRRCFLGHSRTTLFGTAGHGSFLPVAVLSPTLYFLSAHWYMQRNPGATKKKRGAGKLTFLTSAPAQRRARTAGAFLGARACAG